jgi:hypothetical protein
MAIGAPKEVSALRRFFLEPRLPKHRQYEALRAYLVEGRPRQRGGARLWLILLARVA